jgi:DNA-binding winged helix-turn-helix (wHTH) protein
VTEDQNPELAGTVYRFGAFELDPGLYVLRREGIDLDVQPKVLDLLLYLVARRGRVVPKEEVLEALWAGVAATDDVLSRAIHAARQAVGDDGGQQSVIQTVRRRGFRFVAEVDLSGSPQPAPANSTAETRPARQGPAFVGRERELQHLQEALDDANESHGRIVFVSSEAGGGKTRLLEEFSRRAAATLLPVFPGWANKWAPTHSISRESFRACARCFRNFRNPQPSSQIRSDFASSTASPPSSAKWPATTVPRFWFSTTFSGRMPRPYA